MTKGVGARYLDELQRRLAPLLKANGFKKSGRCHFRIHNNRRYDVIELRVSIYGSLERSRFTAELYQHDSQLEDRGTRRWKTFPKSGSNVFSRNIGTFRPDGHQHWWELSETTDTTAIGDEVAKLLEEVVIPYFGHWGQSHRPFIVPAW
jgi:hypothetical protein